MLRTQDDYFRGWPAQSRNGRTLRARGCHERTDVSRLREAVSCPQAQARRYRGDGQSSSPQARQRDGFARMGSGELIEVAAEARDAKVAFTLIGVRGGRLYFALRGTRIQR